MSQSPATIAEVAKLLKLSTVTVSRVINNSSRVSPETRERVVAALREWGFQTNEAARALVRGRSDAIGLMLSGEGAHPFFSWYQSEYLRGITYEAMQRDYNLVIYTRRDLPHRPADPLAAVRGRQVDGLILLGTSMGSTHIPRLLEAKIPFVLLGLPEPGQETNFIYYDNEGGMEAATDHLIGLGHRRIVFVVSDATSTQKLRLEGYSRAMSRARLDRTIWDVSDYRIEDFAVKVREHLLAALDPTALIVPQNEVATHLMGVFGAMGIRVPESLSMVTFDDTPAASLTTPALTTVFQPLEEMGSLAMRTIASMVETGEPVCPSHILPARLIVRGSSGPPP